MVHEYRYRRVLPGEGTLDLGRFADVVLAKKPDTTVSVEVLSEYWRQRPPSEMVHAHHGRHQALLGTGSGREERGRISPAGGGHEGVVLGVVVPGGPDPGGFLAAVAMAAGRPASNRCGRWSTSWSPPTTSLLTPIRRTDASPAVARAGAHARSAGDPGVRRGRDKLDRPGHLRRRRAAPLGGRAGQAGGHAAPALGRPHDARAGHRVATWRSTPPSVHRSPPGIPRARRDDRGDAPAVGGFAPSFAGKYVAFDSVYSDPRPPGEIGAGGHRREQRSGGPSGRPPR